MGALEEIQIQKNSSGCFPVNENINPQPGAHIGSNRRQTKEKSPNCLKMPLGLIFCFCNEIYTFLMIAKRNSSSRFTLQMFARMWSLISIRPPAKAYSIFNLKRQFPNPIQLL